MTDLPASTAPTAAAHPLVQGRCPACNGASLFLGSGGYVTCSRLDCPDPCAADTQLHRGRPEPSSRWLLEGSRDLSIPQQAPRFTAHPVTPEMERAATERARQAAEESERSAAWFAEHSSPRLAETRCEGCGHRDDEGCGCPPTEGPSRVQAPAVTALYERWVKAGPPPLGVPMARWWDKRLVELRAALEQPAPASVNNPPAPDSMRAQLADLIRNVPVPAADPTPARHIRVTARHPDEPTVNRFALSLVDHIRAEFGDSIRMNIATDAREEPADETATEATGGSCSPGAPETEPNNPKESP
ncbi:hypothetical protein [Streptomyces turgidiscabies]|uniref:hypothetical protein n=1 Tax=Streptomyces turgidiscabies TaxID=85558 RepID=UPI0038F6DBE3